MDHAHSVFNEYDVPKDVRVKAVLTIIKFLYAILEEHLNTDQVNSLAHPYGKNYDTFTVYHELKNQALAFSREQLFHGTLLQYIEAMQNPGK
jgi:hypothetical protein